MLKTIKQQVKKNLTDKQFWLSNLKTLALMLVIVFAVTHYQQRNMSQGLAPKLANLDYSQGPTLVYFWASWCGVCKTTSGSVSSLADSAKNNSNNDSHQVISIALSSGSDDDIAQYQQEHEYQFETINDDAGLISQQWGVAVTPSFFIIDKQGMIHSTSTGMTSPWGMKLRLWLASFD